MTRMNDIHTYITPSITRMNDIVVVVDLLTKTHLQF